MKQHKSYKIHFVCRGNTYRSRLAAAYMATLLDDKFNISSSGISASLSTTKTSELYTKATAKAHKLSYEVNTPKTQTTNETLADADVIVFMNKDVYDDALSWHDFDTRKVLVWDVSDMSHARKEQTLAKHSEQALVDASANTFKRIQRHCNELYEYLTHTSWVDVVDIKNHATGLRLPMAWATDRGLWHRGVHVVVQTHDGKFVVSKRSKNIVFAPGMLEISLGGGMDSGETPLRAAQRETQEELGILIHEKEFRPLFMWRQLGYHPRYHKQTKAHIYVYTVTLPKDHKKIVIQREEVDEVRLLSKRQTKNMLRTHRMRHFGRLKWGYKLYQKAVAYSTLPL